MQYNFDFFKKYKVLRIFFSQKKDGSMKLTSDSVLAEKIFQNRNGYFLKNNIDPKKVISAEISHSNKIEIVDGEKEKIISRADGLITKNKKIYLSVTSADCLPIFLFEPKKEIVGMIHAGWKSLEKDILSNAVGKIAKLGGKPENILAGIGPAICQKHYEVGPEVAEKFTKYPEAIKKTGNKILLDIKRVAELQLLEIKLKKENIEISSRCTFEMPDKYFSARRDLPLTNCADDKNIELKRIDEFHKKQLVGGKPKNIEAMIAVIGMKE